jgi:hypothetical protein
VPDGLARPDPRLGGRSPQLPVDAVDVDEPDDDPEEPFEDPPDVESLEELLLEPLLELLSDPPDDELDAPLEELELPERLSVL